MLAWIARAARTPCFTCVSFATPDDIKKVYVYTRIESTFFDFRMFVAAAVVVRFGLSPRCFGDISHAHD